jgi:hypothetical protein
MKAEKSASLQQHLKPQIFHYATPNFPQSLVALNKYMRLLRKGAHMALSSAAW